MLTPSSSATRARHSVLASISFAGGVGDRDGKLIQLRPFARGERLSHIPQGVTYGWDVLGGASIMPSSWASKDASAAYRRTRNARTCLRRKRQFGHQPLPQPCRNREPRGAGDNDGSSDAGALEVATTGGRNSGVGTVGDSSRWSPTHAEVRVAPVETATAGGKGSRAVGRANGGLTGRTICGAWCGDGSGFAERPGGTSITIDSVSGRLINSSVSPGG